MYIRIGQATPGSNSFPTPAPVVQEPLLKRPPQPLISAIAKAFPTPAAKFQELQRHLERGSSLTLVSAVAEAINQGTRQTGMARWTRLMTDPSSVTTIWESRWVPNANGRGGSRKPMSVIGQFTGSLERLATLIRGYIAAKPNGSVIGFGSDLATPPLVVLTSLTGS